MKTFNFFFDNDQRQLDDVKQEFGDAYACIKVDEDPRVLPPFVGNTYVDAHVRTPQEATTGLTEQHFVDLMHNLEGKDNNTPAHVVFDWDNTISVVNGLHLPKESENIVAEDVVEYLMGGAERLEMLRDRFKELQAVPNVTVSILTNNSSIESKTGNKPAFFALALAVLGKPFQMRELIAAADYPNKGVALRQYKKVGGRTRTKRRRRRAKSRRRTMARSASPEARPKVGHFRAVRSKALTL